jgi:hypothetical protein
MVAPPSIASTTRLRKSSEYGLAIHAGLLPVGSSNHIRARMGIPDSAFSGNALAFDLPEFLIRNRERVLTKDDLIASIWNGRIVSESALSRRLK